MLQLDNQIIGLSMGLPRSIGSWVNVPAEAVIFQQKAGTEDEALSLQPPDDYSKATVSISIQPKEGEEKPLTSTRAQNGSERAFKGRVFRAQ